MRDKLLAFARAEGLFDGVEHIVCAVSGGADSVALLYCLNDLRPDFGFTLSAAHFNHCLRGAESDEDEAFVMALCRSWNIPLVTGRADVPAFAREHKLSTEDAARKLRYRFLLSQPGHIAVAHHADDQVETVLLNLLRGTGLKGLCAMAPRQDRILRPCLTVTAGEIRAYLQALDLPHREDSSNAGDDALRNRLRHHVVPLLYAENPALSASITRMTAQLRQDEEFLEAAAQELLRAASAGRGLRCDTLRDAPPVLRRRAIRSLLDSLPNPSKVHVDAVEQLLARENGSAEVHLPGGVTIRREYGLLRRLPEEDRKVLTPTPLPPGASVFLPGYEIQISRPHIPCRFPDQKTAFALKPELSLLARSRASGDVLRLQAGTKSLKKLMIDRKIPAASRDLVPVIACGSHVAAVYGLGVDRELAAKPGEPAVVVTILQEEREI